MTVLAEWYTAMASWHAKFSAALALENLVSGGRTSLLEMVADAWGKWWDGHIALVAVPSSVSSQPVTPKKKNK